MKTTLKITRIQFILFTAGMLLLPLLGKLYLHNTVANPQFFMPCLSKVCLHLYCPGCGGTHALKYLLEGDLLASLQANPLVIYGAVVLLYYWIRFFIRSIKCKCFLYEMNLFYIWGLLILLLGFFLLRNLLLIFAGYDYLGELAPFW